MIKRIIHNGSLLAIIIKSEHSKEGIEFFTPDDYSQQLAYIHHKEGKIIDAHKHNIIERKVEYTNEVLVIKKGKLRVDFYNNKKYIESYILNSGDIILLAHGEHGFKCLEEVEMYEIKQGPYLGEKDKIRFTGINDNEVVYAE